MFSRSNRLQLNKYVTGISYLTFDGNLSRCSLLGTDQRFSLSVSAKISSKNMRIATQDRASDFAL